MNMSRGVLPTLPHLRHPVRPETYRRTAIRQTYWDRSGEGSSRSRNANINQ